MSYRSYFQEWWSYYILQFLPLHCLCIKQLFIFSYILQLALLFILII